jgi:hypothetical protein
MNKPFFVLSFALLYTGQSLDASDKTSKRPKTPIPPRLRKKIKQDPLLSLEPDLKYVLLRESFAQGTPESLTEAKNLITKYYAPVHIQGIPHTIQGKIYTTSLFTDIFIDFLKDKDNLFRYYEVFSAMLTAAENLSANTFKQCTRFSLGYMKNENFHASQCPYEQLIAYRMTNYHAKFYNNERFIPLFKLFLRYHVPSEKTLLPRLEKEKQIYVTQLKNFSSYLKATQEKNPDEMESVLLLYDEANAKSAMLDEFISTIEFSPHKCIL